MVDEIYDHDHNNDDEDFVLDNIDDHDHSNDDEDLVLDDIYHGRNDDDEDFVLDNIDHLHNNYYNVVDDIDIDHNNYSDYIPRSSDPTCRSDRFRSDPCRISSESDIFHKKPIGSDTVFVGSDRNIQIRQDPIPPLWPGIVAEIVDDDVELVLVVVVDH